MKEKLRDQLELLRRDVTRSAAKKFLCQDAEDLTDQVQRIETCQKLLDAFPSDRKRDLLIAGIMTMVCLVLVVSMYLFRVPLRRVNCDIVSKSVTIWLAEALELSELRVADWLSLEDVSLSSVSLDLRDKEATVGGEISGILIQGEQVAIGTLAFGEGALLGITIDDDGFVNLFGRAEPLKGRILLTGQAQVSVKNKSFMLDTYFPETIDFESQGIGRITFRLKEDLELEGLRIAGISFERLQSRSDLAMSSVIIAGTIRMQPLLGQTLGVAKLDEGDVLVAPGMKHGRIEELRVTDRVHVRFSGAVRRVYGGPVGMYRNLSPRLLAYLYDEKRLPLFVSAFTLMWAILWTIRKLLS